MNDYIYLTPTGEIEDDAEVFNYTQENAKLYGGEIGFHLHPHPLDWLHLESTFETVIGKQDSGNYLPLIPANKWNNILKTEYNIGDWLDNGYATLTISHTFKQENASDFETISDGYTLINTAFGGNIKFDKTIFELTANVNNLFDTSYIPHLSRLKSEGINAIGRNFILGINFELN